MNAVLNIITALGIDTSLWYQLTIFIFTFVFVRQFIFAPYFKAYEGRQGQTVGYQKKAEQIFAQTRELEMHYQRKARGLTAEIQSIYDKAKSEAAKEQERIQQEASERARVALEKARSQIQEQYNRAREELIKQAPEIGAAMTAQLLSKRMQ